MYICIHRRMYIYKHIYVYMYTYMYIYKQEVDSFVDIFFFSLFFFWVFQAAAPSRHPLQRSRNVLIQSGTKPSSTEYIENTSHLRK